MAVAMTPLEKLLREIEELKQAIRIDREDLNSNLHREEEREQVRNHMNRCQAELEKLTERALASNDRLD
jgi:ribosome recycling factor